LHVLFPIEAERERLAAAGLLSRKACQFHWHNDGYTDFDDFLTRFSSAKRKKAKRERRRVAEAEIAFEHLRGDEPSDAEWDAIFEFYSRTFERRGRPPYLNRAFFAEIAHTMREPRGHPRSLPRRTDRVRHLLPWRRHTLWPLLGQRGGLPQPALRNVLLPRYRLLHPRAAREVRARHAGEHKISRGFTPSATWSCHWLGDRDFHEAVVDFLARETHHVDAYMDELDDHVPYRDDALPTTTAP
jgi:predicted N-acyltransferase